MSDQEIVDAIPTDVSTEQQEQQPRPKSARELAMEAVENSHLRRLEEETGVKLTEEVPTEAAAPAPEADTQLEAQLAEPAVIEDPAAVRVKIKVDGVEQEVPLADVLRQYQKGEAADRRLEEATRLLKEAKEQAQQQPAQPQQDQAVTQPQAGPEELETAVKAALSKLYEGDEDAAAKALVEVMARGGPQQQAQPTPQAPAVDINEIAEQLQQRNDVNAALKTVKTDYPEIIANRDLEMLAYLKVQQKEATGTSRAAAIIEAADEVYATLGKKPGRQVDPDEVQRETKLARKAAMDNIPAANVAAASPNQVEDDSPSAVIAAMAQKRLGQSLPR